MAERKAVNKYYPPDWDPRKGSVNKRVGQHPLRDRAKKLGQGILVIRFELPYNIWCGGCGSHVGMGVRYNAEKSKVGNYYSTPIYKFRMKCHLCDNYFEIQTDPKNHDYVILCGARRKEQRWDPVANEQIVPEDKATQKKMAMDAMYKLEHGSDDKVRGKEKVKNLAELESSKFSMKEDYLLNRMARDKFRTEKKQLKEAAEADKSIIDRGGLDIELLEETEDDRNLAGLLKYSVTSSYEEKQKEKRKSIEQRPLFDAPKSALSLATPSSSSSSTKLSDNQESNEDTKQKLSETLRLARKDPFAIAEPVKLFSITSSKPSTLGIRLKHSKVTKRSLGKSNISKKAVLSHLKAHSYSRPLTKFNKEIIQASSISESVQTNESSSTNETEKQFLSDTPVAKIYTQRKFYEEGKVKVEMMMGKNTSGVSEEQDNSILSTPDTSSLSISRSTSGLSILMSSYDEDRDSDSYSSS